ncbi:MAG: AMIN domain-containing protein [Terriglobales bacterium]
MRDNLRVAIAVGMLFAGAPRLFSQTPVQIAAKPAPKSGASSAASKVAAIKSFRIVQEKDGPAVEILSTKPLVPSIQAITDPDRLVIDLPNARLATHHKRISVQADQIGNIRADQFQQNPPVARVVVDLLVPRTYTWDAAGNRLVVHLGKDPGQTRSSPFEPPTVPSLMPAPQPVVSEVRAAGPLALAEANGGAGSAITAGPDTAVLRLSSGGEVHVCPGTTVSVTPSGNRHNLMLSMNTGALEAHFALDASSDSVMTPDFRILLVGPGEFHYAISADHQGNTCVRALPGNTASAIVTELLGDRTYQVKATDQLMFHSGQLDRVDMAVPLECGCPPPRTAPLRATNTPPTENQAQAGALPPLNRNPAPVAKTVHAESTPATARAASPLDAAVAPNELHVQIDAPFVFHATGPPPAPVEDVSALPLDSRPPAAPALAAPLPPPAKQRALLADRDTASAHPEPVRGFFRKIGRFFAGMFH